MARGTEIRQRKIVLTARFNDAEAAAIRERADRHGQSVGGLIRKALELDELAMATIRRPPANSKAVALFLGAQGKARDVIEHCQADLGKASSNTNQIARVLNAGRPPERVMGLLESVLREQLTGQMLLNEAIRDILELRRAGMQSLGFERNRKVKD
jgi:hypothetical protein